MAGHPNFHSFIHDWRSKTMHAKQWKCKTSRDIKWKTQREKEREFHFVNPSKWQCCSVLHFVNSIKDYSYKLQRNNRFSFAYCAIVDDYVGSCCLLSLSLSLSFFYAHSKTHFLNLHWYGINWIYSMLIGDATFMLPYEFVCKWSAAENCVYTLLLSFIRISQWRFTGSHIFVFKHIESWFKSLVWTRNFAKVGILNANSLNENWNENNTHTHTHNIRIILR